MRLVKKKNLFWCGLVVSSFSHIIFQSSYRPCESRRSQSLFLQVLVVCDVFQKRFHTCIPARARAHELCDLVVTIPKQLMLIIKILQCGRKLYNTMHISTTYAFIYSFCIYCKNKQLGQMEYISFP